MTIGEIKAKLEASGVDCKLSGERVYIYKTPNGSKGQYGYCVEGDDVRDVTRNISKRNGEISAILRAQ